MNTQLLLTFTTEKYLTSSIDSICSIYEILDGRIFVLKNLNNPSELFLTYNILQKNYTTKPPRTILIHRKKETNTLYTINAVNQIILDEVGVYDTEFEINWKLYENSLLLSNNGELRTNPTELMKIVKI